MLDWLWGYIHNYNNRVWKLITEFTNEIYNGCPNTTCICLYEELTCLHCISLHATKKEKKDERKSQKKVFRIIIGWEKWFIPLYTSSFVSIPQVLKKYCYRK